MDAFVSLRDKMIDARTQLKQLSMQEKAKERSMRECALVSEQLEPLSSDTRMYKANGRAYFLSSRDEILSELKRTVENCEKEIETLKTGQTKVESVLKETEQNLQELLKTSPELVTQTASSTSP